MTAFATATVRDMSLVAESDLRIVRLTGSGASAGFTYTPSNPSSKTILVLSCYDQDSAGDAVTVTQSTGVLTVDAGGATTTEYVLMYALL